MGKYCRAGQATDGIVIRRMRFASWVPNVPNTYSEYTILISFPRQQWLRERAPQYYVSRALSCLVGVDLPTSVSVVFGYQEEPPLWSSGQSFWLQTQRSRFRSPALPDFLSSSGSGTGSTQPREVN